MPAAGSRVAVWVLEVAVLLVGIFQFARIAAKPAFRIETVWKPGWKWPLVGSALLLGGLGLWAAWRWPLLRHAGAATLAVLLAAAWWRARPSYGRLRKLPPGSLGLGHSLDALPNPRYYLEQAARYGPVFKTSEFGRPVVCIVGLTRIRTILAAQGASFAGARFTRRYHRFIPRGLLRYMDPGTHQEYAPRFRAAYGSLALQQAEPLLRNIYRANLTRLADDSDSDERGVAVLPCLRRAMLEAVGYLFYGLTPGDPQLDQLERCLPLLHAPALGTRGWQGKTRQGFDGIRTIVAKVSTMSAEDGTGYTPALRALASGNPAAMDDPTIIGNFILISHIAHGDLTGLHRWIFKMLSDHPAALAPVRAGRPDAATRIVMETLRLSQSEFLYRRVTRNFEYEGMTVPAGWMLRCCVQESHRDPAMFPEPHRFAPERFAQLASSRDQYAPFGADAHGCMGSHIAHFLGRLFVEELALGFDWRVVTDGPPERAGNRHRDHWHPSSRQRVVMTSRVGPDD